MTKSRRRGAWWWRLVQVKWASFAKVAHFTRTAARTALPHQSSVNINISAPKAEAAYKICTDGGDRDLETVQMRKLSR